MDFSEMELWESVALSVLHLGMGAGDEKDFDIVRLGDSIQVKVSGVETGAELKVVGEDYNELGEQLVLACLHNLSAGDLAQLSLRELNKDVPGDMGGKS